MSRATPGMPLVRRPRAFAQNSVTPRQGVAVKAAVGSTKAGMHCLLMLLLLGVPAVAREIDPDTGLVIAPGYEQVRAQCTICHSARLVIQNRANRTGWLQMIRWMQESQGLWPLGDAEPLILDYLEQNYGPRAQGRRAPLVVTFDE